MSLNHKWANAVPIEGARRKRRARFGLMILTGFVSGVALGVLAINFKPLITSAFMPSVDSSVQNFAARGGSLEPGDIRVIDGDTIRVHHKQPDVRLVGFNTPETRRAQCNAESELGAKATRRLREIVRGGKLDLAFVACACPAGTEGTQACNFGRHCGALKVDGRDVGAILISEKLAVPFRCGATSCPPPPRPWCR